MFPRLLLERKTMFQFNEEGKLIQGHARFRTVLRKMRAEFAAFLKVSGKLYQGWLSEYVHVWVMLQQHLNGQVEITEKGYKYALSRQSWIRSR